MFSNLFAKLRLKNNEWWSVVRFPPNDSVDTAVARAIGKFPCYLSELGFYIPIDEGLMEMPLEISVGSLFQAVSELRH